MGYLRPFTRPTAAGVRMIIRPPLRRLDVFSCPAFYGDCRPNETISSAYGRHRSAISGRSPQAEADQLHHGVANAIGSVGEVLTLTPRTRIARWLMDLFEGR